MSPTIIHSVIINTSGNTNVSPPNTKPVDVTNYEFTFSDNVVNIKAKDTGTNVFSIQLFEI